MEQETKTANRAQSFLVAFLGILAMLKTERNARIHALATILVCAIGLVLGFCRTDWCLIVLSITAVWTAEALNTALENLADVASPDFHPLVKKSKDVAAGAVLITAIGAMIIGVLVIEPYLSIAKSQVKRPPGAETVHDNSCPTYNFQFDGRIGTTSSSFGRCFCFER